MQAGGHCARQRGICGATQVLAAPSAITGIDAVVGAFGWHGIITVGRSSVDSALCGCLDTVHPARWRRTPFASSGILCVQIEVV
jgi:hypothetical protein